MKAIYSEPKTKAMSLNLRAAICTEPPVEVSTNPDTPPTDEPAPTPPTDEPAPMF